jgi:3-phosphoshikimate 1-carboxyvinyltransferase
MELTLNPSTIAGSLPIVTSKSQTIRALLIAAFSEGTSIIHNPLTSSDTTSCLEAIKKLGVKVEERGDSLVVTSSGTFPETIDLDFGNSGTSMYLTAGMIASTSTKATFTGDKQLKNRPIRPLLEALINLGVSVTYPKENSKKWYPPFTLQGPIHGGEVDITCHTSQHLSALLLGCVMGKETTVVNVKLLNERPYVEMSLKWLEKQHIQVSYDTSMKEFTIPGKQHYRAFETTIAGDFSSASFFFCAAAITGKTLTITGLDKDDPQGDKEVLSILEKMGCTATWVNDSVTVSTTQELQGGTFDLNSIPDALPILAVTACFAKGKTILGNVPQARIKETDRIESMKKNLSSLGVKVEDTEDSLIIYGNQTIQGGLCSGFDDHRIIMAMAIASLRATGPITIDNIDAVSVTFPTFFTLLDSIKKEI